MAATVDKDKFTFHFVSTEKNEAKKYETLDVNGPLWVHTTHSMAMMVSLYDTPDGSKFPINYHVAHFIALSCWALSPDMGAIGILFTTTIARLGLWWKCLAAAGIDSSPIPLSCPCFVMEIVKRALAVSPDLDVKDRTLELADIRIPAAVTGLWTDKLTCRMVTNQDKYGHSLAEVRSLVNQNGFTDANLKSDEFEELASTLSAVAIGTRSAASVSQLAGAGMVARFIRSTRRVPAPDCAYATCDETPLLITHVYGHACATQTRLLESRLLKALLLCSLARAWTHHPVRARTPTA